MRYTMLAGKIHRATVTDTNLDYEGSITIDKDLLDAARIPPFSQVQIYNITNGERFETYTIVGDRGSGSMAINGAASYHRCLFYTDGIRGCLFPPACSCIRGWKQLHHQCQKRVAGKGKFTTVISCGPGSQAVKLPYDGRFSRARWHYS
jgi:hypothetical protein